MSSAGGEAEDPSRGASSIQRLSRLVWYGVVSPCTGASDNVTSRCDGRGASKPLQLAATKERTDTINASETLNNANRIPVDIVIYKVITVLEILTLRNTIRTNKDI